MSAGSLTVHRQFGSKARVAGQLLAKRAAATRKRMALARAGGNG
jgi:hypothetical protein